MVSGLAPIQPVGSTARASAADVQKLAAWCMIRANPDYAPAVIFE
jgi:hypothetical protein